MEGNRHHEVVVVVTASEKNHVTGQYCVVYHCLVRNQAHGNCHDVTLAGYYDYSGDHHVHDHHIDLVHHTILNVSHDSWWSHF